MSITAKLFLILNDAHDDNMAGRQYDIERQNQPADPVVFGLLLDNQIQGEQGQAHTNAIDDGGKVVLYCPAHNWIDLDVQSESSNDRIGHNQVQDIQQISYNKSSFHCVSSSYVLTHQ